MAVTIFEAASHMTLALSCGAFIGMERQVRRRMAGLRTNALVALGASAFVTFSQSIDVDTSPSRVAAQVVSGIGFLGAGIIFRDGFEVHGLNTAATLWCSAGVGLLSASGDWHLAVLLTGLVVFVNLGLRPLVRLLKRHATSARPQPHGWRVALTTATADEPAIRALILRSLPLAGFLLQDLSAERREGQVDLSLTVTGEDKTEADMAQLFSRWASEPQILRIETQGLEEG
jgi:putative Mg2+ transporter-C (MgtC) family protein